MCMQYIQGTRNLNYEYLAFDTLELSPPLLLYTLSRSCNVIECLIQIYSVTCVIAHLFVILHCFLSNLECYICTHTHTHNYIF